MLNTFIKNTGTSKTVVQKNNHNYINEVKWNANYDGKNANISIDSDSNGKEQHYDIKLDNDDLANMLTIEQVDMPIDERLLIDFQHPSSEYRPYYIELQPPKLKPRKPIIKEPKSRSIKKLMNKYILLKKTLKKKKHKKSKSKKTKKSKQPKTNKIHSILELL